MSSRETGAQVINYPGGFAGSTGQIWLENGAKLAGPAIQLTTAGTTSSANNAWFMTPVNVEAFTTTFTFAETCPMNCGDGFGFMIISVSNPSSAGYNYSGFSGGQFSWSQCTGTGDTNCPSINSLLVKFDLYNLQTGQTGANLTGFYTDGEYPQLPNPQYDMSASGINLESGDMMRATLAYNGTVFSETLTDTVTGATFTNSYTTDIPALVGGKTGYVGFGGSMAVATATQDLQSWTYTIESPGQAALPTFSPAGGTYSGSQRIVLSSASAGAIICYNTTGSPATNGSTGCSTGTMYTGPVTVAASETLFAIAGGTGYDDSPVGSASYVIQNLVATPTFSPAAGTYSSAQSVTISDVTSNATVYYTTNGTAPTTSSTKYIGPILVNSAETLEAIAVATGETNSSVASAAYTISSPTSVATPVFSPATGNFTSVQSVIISDTTSGVTIYYTTDGTAPTTASNTYSTPITVDSTETVKAVGVVMGSIESAVASAAYTIDLEPSVASPTFSPPGGAYTATQAVIISDATPDASIFYTANGTTPTASSTEYTGPITVSSTETLKAIAVEAGDNNSAAVFAAYNITPPGTVSTPTFTPAAGAYTSAQTVTIADTTPDATVYYTTNGTAPTTSSTVYSGPVTVSSTETLEAIAVAKGDTNSAVASAAYTITSALPVVATPTFSPAGGTYTSSQSVTLADATPDASIYYTTNGATPTTSSTAYGGPIAVTSTETLEAIAVAAGDASSAVVSAAYTINSQPSFTLGASSTSLTIDSGGQGTLTLTVTPENEFASPVSLACAGLPSGAACSFTPATITPSGAAVTSQLTISTGAQSSIRQPGRTPLLPFTALTVTVYFFGWRRRWKCRNGWLLLAAGFFGLGLLSGCGGNSGTSTTSTTASPAPAPVATTSMVTITATSGSLQQTVTITLTI